VKHTVDVPEEETLWQNKTNENPTLLEVNDLKIALSVSVVFSALGSLATSKAVDG